MAMSTPPWRTVPPGSGYYRSSDSGYNSVNVKKNISKPFFTTKQHNAQPPSQTPTTASQAGQQKKTHFPDALKAYVARTFENCPSEEKEGVEVELKRIITDAFEKNVVWTIDWDTFPLPAAKKAQQVNLITTATTSSPPESPIPTSKFSAVKLNGDGSSHKGTKRKLGKPWETASQSPVSSLADSDRSYRKPKRLNNGEDYEGPDAFDRLNKRYERNQSKLYTSSSLCKPSTPLPNDGVIVGRCQDLEKRYLRLTAPPHPDTVRPLHVLEKTLEFLKAKWKAENNYSYICDQFKSLRQDLTVQHIKNEFTVNVYEIHARIALEKGDLGEYNQCQSQLYSLYSEKIGGGHPMEFKAYRILYLIHTRNLSEMKDLLADLTATEKDNPFILHALNVRSAVAAGNYNRFFKLYLDAPNMGAYLIDSFIARERLSALCTICKAYRPDIPLRHITEELGFEADEEAVGFIATHNAQGFLELKSDGSLRLQAQALQTLESAKNTAHSKVDIKGQI